MLQRAQANNRTTFFRPDLSDRSLRLLVAALVLMIATFVLAKSHLPLALQRPGSVLLQSAAALGSLLLFVPVLFFVGNDQVTAGSPIFSSSCMSLQAKVGIALVSGHALARPQGPPLILLALLLLSVRRRKHRHLANAAAFPNVIASTTLRAAA